MAIGDYDVVGRAARILREAPEPGWRAIENRVIDAVRATPRSGWPLDVTDPDGGVIPGALRVSDLVLHMRLVDALTGDPDFVVTDVEIASTDTTLERVAIHLTGRYGAVLPAAGARAEAACRAVLADVVGSVTQVTVTVIVDDVFS